METSATIRIPTQKEIDKVIEELRSVEKKLSDFTIVLQPPEREALPHLPAGCEGAAAAAAHLARKLKIEIAGTSVQAMEDHFMQAERLKTLYRETYLLSQRINDSILKAQAEAWIALQKHAAALNALAEKNPRLATDLEPINEFVTGGGQARGAL